jgi:hypothetical protein
MQLGRPGMPHRIVVSVHSCWSVGVREIRSVYAVSPTRHVEQYVAETMPHTHKLNLLVFTVHHGQATGPPAPVLSHIMKGFRQELISRARSTAPTPAV